MSRSWVQFGRVTLPAPVAGASQLTHTLNNGGLRGGGGGGCTVTAPGWFCHGCREAGPSSMRREAFEAMHKDCGGETTRDELDATVIERAKRRYPETLSGEEQDALSRAAQALRVKGMLVEALERLFSDEYEFQIHPEQETQLRAALAEARKP